MSSSHYHKIIIYRKGVIRTGTIGVSDKELQKLKALRRELLLKLNRDISLRAVEDAMCDFVLARKDEFINAILDAQRAPAGAKEGESEIKKEEI